MLIVCKDKVIDLSKFETVRWKEILVQAGELDEYFYPVEAIRQESDGQGSVITISEEIIRFKEKDVAEEFINLIVKKWVAGTEAFNVMEKYNRENNLWRL